jgi:hypothetical protein
VGGENPVKREYFCGQEGVEDIVAVGQQAHPIPDKGRKRENKKVRGGLLSADHG